MDFTKMISITQSKRYCIDYTKIENYELAISDNTQIWDCHHKKEIEENKTPEQLIKEGLYYSRPPQELIFLTHGKHSKLHSINVSKETKRKNSEANTGKVMSKETRKKMSLAKKGVITWNKGLPKEKQPYFGKQHSEQTRIKLRIAQRRRREREKIQKLNLI